MEITVIKALIRNPAHPEKERLLEFLVDSGATFSVISEDILNELGIEPHREQEFVLADGTKIKRKIGDAIFEINGLRAASPVVFGEKEDSILLGVFTLESLGFILDPFKRELRPAKLLMV